MSKYTHIFKAIHDEKLAADPAAHGVSPLVDKITRHRFGWIDTRNEGLMHAIRTHGGGALRVYKDEVVLDIPTEIAGMSLKMTAQGRADERTRILNDFAMNAGAHGHWPFPGNESIPVYPNKFKREPFAHVDRMSVYPFGIMARGVHLIAKDEAGNYLLQRRSRRVAMYKGALDVTVGGLVGSGQTPRTTLAIEGFEEIGLSAAWAKAQIERQKPRTYEYMRRIHNFPQETNGGIWHDHVYAWSVTIPRDFTPKFRDGDVKRLVRVSPAELEAHLMEEGAVKPNSAVMLLDDLRLSGHFDRWLPTRKAIEKQLKPIQREKPDFKMTRS